MIEFNPMIAAQAYSPHPWLMVAEIEHRVANEYALAIGLLSLAAARASNAEAKTALAGTAARLRDYASVHRALQAPVAGGAVDLSEYLRGLCGALARASLSERGTSLTLIEHSVDIEAGRCWRVGLIVSELITNSIRHGIKGAGGAITVEITRSSDLIQCRVSDNGQAGARWSPGRGARVVDALAQDLGGMVERRADAHGTAVLLSFPEHDDSGRPFTRQRREPPAILASE